MQSPEQRHADIIRIAQQGLKDQIQALALIQDSLGANVVRAVDLLVSADTIITSGLGKSSFVARKMAASLNSLRFRATHIHPVDALHGDSGFLDVDDVLVVFSKSGETPELVRFITQAKQIGVRVIAITSRNNSTIGRLADETIVAPIVKELDSMNVIPTASTTSALVVADLLTVCAAETSGNMLERLQRTHPNGAIGSALLRTIDDVMHAGDALPMVLSGQPLNAALIELTTKALGIVCVCDDQRSLIGIVTDGDVRRFVTAGTDVASASVDDVMTTSPLTITADASVHEALLLMENRERQISVLPVVNGNTVVGVVRVHDLVRVTL